MKRAGTVWIVLFLIAAIVLSFFAGDYMRKKAHKEDLAEQFGNYISLAIDIVENKGLSIVGAPEAIVSNIWVAHELCDHPEISAELSNLWNTLVYEKDTLAGQEGALISQLKNILERYP